MTTSPPAGLAGPAGHVGGRSAVSGGARLLHLPAGTRPGAGGPARPMSVPAMKAAVIAIRAGAFDGDLPAEPPADALARPVPAGHVRGPGEAAALGLPTVVVLAGHAGAGASTVALAIAEALTGPRRVQLVEFADPCRSGLGMASDSELGVDAAGWRRGRRDALILSRRSAPGPSPANYPLPPTAPPDAAAAPPDAAAGDGVLVLDAGCPAAAAVTGAGGLAELLSIAQLVVVTRMTVPGIRQTEHLLGCLPGSAVLATVAAGRWPGVVAASCGPHLRAARAAGRAVMVPMVRRLEVDGLTPDPLPKPVAAAGKALAALLSPDQPVLTGLSLPPHREDPT
ncbi:MAG: hypothetical protein ACR2JO_05460 [Mycobacteriales bacterium]